MATDVRPIPEGFHTLTPGLVVGDVARAVEFYKKAFGAEEQSRITGPQGTVTHAELKIGDSIFMLGPESQNAGTRSPHSLHGTPVSLNLYTVDADALFARAVKAGAHVEEPVHDAFWGDRYGKLIDPFGHVWGLCTRKENLT